MKPMRAGKFKDMKNPAVEFPVMASFKMDGIRSYNEGGAMLSKNSKKIPNAFIQSRLGHRELHGLDGELVVGPPNLPTTMSSSTSGVMSRAGKPDVTFYVFDDFSLDYGFYMRWKLLKKRISEGGWPMIKVVEHRMINTMAELLAFEQEALDAGYEGLMLRAPGGPYKQGTSTEREGYMMKFKRFLDAEAVILGYNELMHNGNEKGTDGKRTSHKAGKTPLGTLGSLKVRVYNGEWEGCEFDCPVPLPADRDYIWAHRPQLIGAVVRFKYFPSGTKDKPRFPGFFGFRDKRDTQK